jgi:uncharacterized protein
MILSLVLAFWVVELTSCNAASFNCSSYLERRACPEMLICSEPTLSRLDDIMASLYQDARNRMSATMSAGFRDYQREWLARRAKCGCNFNCLEREYRAQIDALRRTIREMN